MDIKQLAEQLIVQLWSESDKLRERAEGVRLFLQTIIQEAEKQNEQDNKPDNESGKEKQAE